MLENDTHAHGSIDRLLIENMIRLCPETVDYLYREYTPIRSLYQKGTRPELEQCIEEAVFSSHSDEERIEAITQFTSSLQKNATDDLDLIRVGGTEEEIIARGSDWCSDVARVGCALCQVAGFPARIVDLVDTEKAYSGHVIIEVYRDKTWGAVDLLTGVIYRHPEGNPASTWELMNNPHLAEAVIVVARDFP
jgi:transglutaminase-like putative cysteine protease